MEHVRALIKPDPNIKQMPKQEDEVKGANEFSISCKYLRWITLCSLKPHDRSWS